MTQERLLRKQIVWLLSSGDAHADFEEVVAKLPAKFRALRPPGLPYTPWRLLEHMRIAQWDILEFCRNPRHESPPYPEGYWPNELGPAGAAQWDKSVKQFLKDNQAIVDLVMDPSTDLMAQIAHGQGQTILREALLAADHNAYHMGQMIVVRRLIGALETDNEAPDNI